MHTILILEDHPMMVGPIKASVQGMPFKTKIHTASSLGELKVDLQPALIVADLNLPDSQGLKTLTWLRGQYRQAQILVFSQIDDPAIQAQVLELGACGYVSRPRPTLAKPRDATRRGSATHPYGKWIPYPYWGHFSLRNTSSTAQTWLVTYELPTQDGIALWCGCEPAHKTMAKMKQGKPSYSAKQA